MTKAEQWTPFSGRFPAILATMSMNPRFWMLGILCLSTGKGYSSSVFGSREFFSGPNSASRALQCKVVLDAEVPDKYTLTDHLWRYLQGYAEKHKAAGNGFGFGLTSLDGIARTLSARYYKDGSEILIPQPSKNPRRLTPRECSRLMGFPADFKIPVSDTQAYKQFGNSVVVPLIARLARQVVRSLESPPENDRDALPSLFHVQYEFASA